MSREEGIVWAKGDVGSKQLRHQWEFDLTPADTGGHWLTPANAIENGGLSRADGANNFLWIRSQINETAGEMLTPADTS